VPLNNFPEKSKPSTEIDNQQGSSLGLLDEPEDNQISFDESPEESFI